MAEFRMPSLGTDMESGMLVEWLKHPGDVLRKGDIVAVVETQKGAIEVEIFVNGVMGSQLVALGTTVPVGTPLAIVEQAGAPKQSGLASSETAAEAPRQAVVKTPVALVRPPLIGIRASPAARKAAAERGLDLSVISATGPEGAIVFADVEKAVAKLKAKAHPALDLEKMREAIAAAMAHSKREIPHYYLSNDIDMAHAVAWLENANASRLPADRLLLSVLTLKATALAVRKYPAFNGTYAPPKGFTSSKSIHAAPAIAIRGGGLVAPAIHDCDRKDLPILMAHLRDLVARARVGHLRSSEISDATITVSSLGERGVDSLAGVIYPPQVAIVGFGRLLRKPLAVDDGIAVRPVMTSTLAADHRVSDGHLGSLFLNEISALLQEPERL